jgi:prevent-host-death family protein
MSSQTSLDEEMMEIWQLQEAKARLSELVKKAQTEGPQHITVRGERTAVVLSERELKRLTRNKPSFLELMRHSPLADVELDLTRGQTSARKVEFP